MTVYEMRPLVKMLAEIVQVIFEQPVTVNEAEISRHYDEVVKAFHALDVDDRNQFLCFLLGYAWMGRQEVRALSLAFSTEPRREMWT